MKTSIINNLAATKRCLWHLTVSGLLTISAPLTLSAAIIENTGTNIVITAGSGTAQSDVVFDNAGNTTSPISVSTTGWYSGTRVVVTATGTTGNGRNGVTLATSGTVNLTDSAITANLLGLTASGTSTAILNNTNITTNGITTSGYGVTLATASALTMTGGTVTTGTVTTGTGNTGYGLGLSATSVATLNGVTIVTSSTNGYGVNLATSSTLTMIGGTITTGTSGARGISAGGASYVDLQGTVINSYSGGIYLSGTSVLAPYHASITAQSGEGINLGTSSTATITGGTMTTVRGGNGITLATASAIDVRDTTINAFAVGVSVAGTSVANLDNVNITTQNTSGYGLQLATSSTVSFSGTIVLNGTGASGVYMSGVGTTLRLGDNVSIAANSTGAGINVVGSGANFSAGDNLTINSGGIGIIIAAGSAITAPLNNVNIITRNASAHGIQYASGVAPLTVNGGTIHTLGNSANGLYLGGTSVANLNNVNIITEGTTATGINVATSSTLTVSGGTVTTYAGSGIQVSGSGYIYGENVYVTTHGDGMGNYATRVDGSGTLVLVGGTMRTSGSLAHGVHIGGGDNGDSLATLIGADVQTTGINAAAVHLDANGAIFTKSAVLDGGTYTAAQGSGLAVNQLADNGNGAFSTGIFDITVKGGATVSGTSSVLIGGSGIKDAPVVTINVSEASTLIGDVNTVINGTTALSLSGSSALTGNLTASNETVLTVTLNDSVLTGKSAVADNATLNLSLTNSANWNLTGKSKLTTLHGASGGTITIDNVQGEDLTVSGNNGVSGITGETKLHLTLSDSIKGDQEIWVVVDETDKMTGERFKLGNEVSYGMYQYELVNASDGAWLVYTGTVSGTNPPPGDDDDDIIIDPPPPPPPGRPIISSEGDAIINTAAAVAGFWFTQLDNLHKRMGELRYNKPAGGDLINNVWVRAYGQQINASTGIYSVKGFTETQYGVDLGTDYLWKLDAANQLYTGIFAGYGGADRDFHTNYSDSTDSGYGGLYATWLNNSGWYADVVAKGQYFRNKFSGADRGDYDSLGVGFSAEFGRQFEFKDGWFAEPSVQFSYLHLMNDNYTTRDGMHVDLTDADVLHIYGGARFGRNIKLTNSARLQPYIKAGGLGQISSGNKLTVSGDHWRPNLDGARAVVGAGLIWQLDADSQLHLDYEASFGEKYDKPWGVNFGYRYQF